MTGQQYVDEVKLRLARYKVIKALNDPLILSFVNDARREVQRDTKDMYPERFARIYRNTLTQSEDTVSRTEHGYINSLTQNVYMFDLPADFMNWKAAYLMWVDENGVTKRRILRNSSKKELFTTASHSWSGATMWSPMFAIDRQINRTGVAGSTYPWVMYVTGLNKVGGTTLFDEATNVRAEIWYVAAIDWLEVADDDTQLQDDLEELVIYYAMLGALEFYHDVKAYNSVLQEYNGMQQQVYLNYELRKAEETTRLQSKQGSDV